jgi:hypothetical protein
MIYGAFNDPETGDSKKSANDLFPHQICAFCSGCWTFFVGGKKSHAPNFRKAEMPGMRLGTIRVLEPLGRELLVWATPTFLKWKRICDPGIRHENASNMYIDNMIFITFFSTFFLYPLVN